MLIVTSILGHVSELRFATRRREPIAVAFSDAGKRRLRLTTEGGSDVAVDLPRGSYLADGAVLDDDGERVIVVERTAEEMVVVRLAEGPMLLEQAVTLGNVFGTQHVVVEVVGSTIRIPVTTSAEIALETVMGLGFDTLEATIETARPWADAPPRVGALTHTAGGHSH